MNTSEKDPNKPVMDEVDDLTRFLDEDFGTDEVDLFEFTSGEEDSPLTQLKTIILGLDWEITDEALQDLADEIENLRNLEQFQHDKVSQVYLQALDKIGNYVFSEGANTHPNAIKLLMTLFYDFEKITSSEHITGAEITALLKADVRKFKILQYQIAQKHGATVPEAAAAAGELPITDNKTLLEIHAAILELDWEVTDQSLNNLAKQLTILKDQFAANKYIQILVRGLTTLNRYIDEERARTHPESFTLLHHFFEALETLVEDQDLDEENSQKLLINCVNRLNALKTLITKTPQELDQDAIAPVSDEEEMAVAEKPGETAAPGGIKAPAEEAVIKEPVATAPAFVPPSIEKDEYEDELDVVLPVDEGGEVAPALFEEEEEGGFGDIDAEAEAPSDELEEKLQFFFGDDEDVPPPPEEEIAEEPEIDIFAEEPVAEAIEKVPEEVPAMEEPVAQAPAFAPPAPEKDEYEDVLDVELPVDESGEVAPALFDSEEEGGFTGEEEEHEAPSEELEENLQLFFGEDEETFAPEAVEAAVAQQKIEDEKLAAAELKLREEEEEEFSIAPALAGETEDGGFAAETEEAEAPPEGLEEKLEFFFGDTEAPEPEVGPVTETADLADVPEALFEEDEEEFLLTPALAAVDDKEFVSPPAAETFAAISTVEDFNAALEKMRNEFQEREQSLVDEITALKQEIESLRSSL